MSTEHDMAPIYAKNKGLLMVLTDRTVINRSPLSDLYRLVEEAKQGKTYVNELLDYIGPHGYRRSDLVSPFGLEWTRTQGSQSWERLVGSDHHEAMDLSRRIHAQQEVVRQAAGAPDLHIWKRGTTGELEPQPYPLSLTNSDSTDPIADYVSAWHDYLDYFEHLMGPRDVIGYCEEEIVKNRAYLANGMNIRINQPLTPDEITVVESLLTGYSDAITRNENRLKHPNARFHKKSLPDTSNKEGGSWFGLWARSFAFAYTS